MKYAVIVPRYLDVVSLPVQGAWIEIFPCERLLASALSLPVQGAWIEMVLRKEAILSDDMSLPVQGAWIEI